MFKRRRRRSRRLMGIRVRRRVISNICKHGRHTPKLGKYAGFTVLGSVVQKQVQNLNPGLTQNLKQIFQTFICKLENYFFTRLYKYSYYTMLHYSLYLP